MRRLLLILLCFPLMGQSFRDVGLRDLTLGTAGGASNEQMLPTALAAITALTWRSTDNAECSSIESTCLGYVDEGYQATYDDKRMCNDENITPTTEEIRFDFDTPASSPTATTDAQSIRIAFFRSNASCVPSGFSTADPTFDIRVWDGDSLETIANDVTCPDDAAVDELTYPWTYEGASTGAEVYIEYFDNGNGLTGTARRRCMLEAIDWYAEVQ